MTMLVSRNLYWSWQLLDKKNGFFIKIALCGIYIIVTLICSCNKFKLHIHAHTHNTNDSLMHFPAASTAWLEVVRSAFTDGLLPTLWSHAGALQVLLGHWGVLIRIGCVPDCCQWLSRSILWFVYIPVVCWEHGTAVCGLMAVLHNTIWIF